MIKILTSGFSSRFPDELSVLLKKYIGQHANFAFVASEFEKIHERTDWYCNHFLKMFFDCGINFEHVSVIDSRMSEKEAQSTIKNAHVLWLAGGDTPTQYAYLQAYGLIPWIRQHQGVVIGMSAGSINMAKTAVCTRTCEHGKLKVYEALGLVDFSVEPHLDKNHISEEILELSETYPMYGICDEGAIVCAEDKRLYIGDVFLIDNKKVTQMPHKMGKNDLVLRKETQADYRIVENLTRQAFWNHHVPGCNEHYLMHIIRHSDAFIDALDFVAQVNGEIVGNIVYTKAQIVDDQGDFHQVLSFGPISVLPAFQGRGIGGILIEHTLEIAKELGHRAVLIYGDPDYYSKFGFVAAEYYKIGTSDNMYAVPLQALELVPGALANISGRFLEGEIYEIDEVAVEAFDREFPVKDKVKGGPSQKRFSELVAMRKPRK